MAAAPPTFLLVLCGLSSSVASLIALVSIFMHLKNYRRPDVQRLIIRILFLVPIYSIASFLSLSASRASLVYDAIREIYEAFVIYTFFCLLVNYLGGERELLVLFEDRPRVRHLWPVNYIYHTPIDISDPSTFLRLRRGILQYALVKPVLAFFIFTLKLAHVYDEGYIAWKSPYLWLSLTYNVSISWCMYCLVIFYVAARWDLAIYRPMPKFLCVKAILFFSFWQGLFISFLVALDLLPKAIPTSPYTSENLASFFQDVLICFEMPFFAWGHWSAFSWHDYEISIGGLLSARMPLWAASKDAIGFGDVILDIKHTLQGTLYKSVIRIGGNEIFERTWEDRQGVFVLNREGDPKRHYKNWTRFRDQAQAKNQAQTLDEEGREALIQSMPNSEVGVQLQAGSSRLKKGQREEDRISLLFPDLPYDVDEKNHGTFTSSGASLTEANAKEDKTLKDDMGMTDDSDVEVLYNRSRSLDFGDYGYYAVAESDKLRLLQQRSDNQGSVSNNEGWRGRMVHGLSESKNFEKAVQEQPDAINDVEREASTLDTAQRSALKVSLLHGAIRNPSFSDESCNKGKNK